MSYEEIHTVWDLHENAPQEDWDRIMENGGICMGIAIKWLEQIVVFGNYPENAWPHIGNSIDCQLACQEEGWWEIVESAGIQTSERVSFDYFSGAMDYMWENGGDYIVFLMGLSEADGHAYAFSKNCENNWGHLFDHATGVFVTYSSEALLECFRETLYADLWGEDDMKVIIYEFHARDDYDNGNDDDDDNDDGECYEDTENEYDEDDEEFDGEEEEYDDDEGNVYEDEVDENDEQNEIEDDDEEDHTDVYYSSPGTVTIANIRANHSCCSKCFRR